MRGRHLAEIEAEADQLLDTCRGIGKQLPVAGDGAREDVIDHDCRDRGDEADRGGE